MIGYKQLNRTHRQACAMQPLAAAIFIGAFGAQSAMAEDAPVLEELVVTAQKRAESVQTVPVAVSVMTGQALERINATNISDMTAVTPSVTFTSGFEGRDNSIRIRGVGTDNGSVGVESSVSTVVDGVVLQRPGSAFSDLGDIARVEVLRGPQGTLFGKNSVAGVINVVTNDPTFGAPEGSISLLLAQDEEARLNAVYSAPLSDALAFRVAVSTRTQDGIVENVRTANKLNGSDASAARVKLSFNPSETLKFKLSADYSSSDSTYGASPVYIYAPNAVVPQLSGVAPGKDNDKVNNDVDSFVNQKNYGGSLETNVRVGEHTLTLISALRRFDNQSDFDLDNTGAQLIIGNNNREYSKTTTHELRLSSPIGQFVDYVAGALYFDGTVTNELSRRGLNFGAVVAIDPVTGVLTPRVPTDSAATGVPFAGYATVDVENLGIYGQVNLHPVDRLTVSAGLRYIDEQQRFEFSRIGPAFFNGSDRPATATAFFGVKDFSDTAMTGKGSVSYEISDDVMGYISYSSGYTGKATNSGLGLTPAEFNNPEITPTDAMTSNMYEIGLKSRLWDDRAQINVAIFRTRFEDYQARVRRPDTGLLALQNAGTVGVDGVEVEFAALPSDGLSLSGGVTYSDARFVDSTTGCYAGQTAALGCISVPASGSVAAFTYQALDDKPFMNAPDLRYTLAVRQEFPVAAHVAHVQAGYRWQSKVNFDLAQDPNMVQKAYGIADLSAGITTADERYEFGVFVKNLFDQAYRLAALNFHSAATGGVIYSQQIGRDFHRYFGVTAKVNF